jgi:hypothetical protein
MRRLVKWFEVITFVVVLGFSITACKKDSLDGTTWEAQEFVLEFKNPNYTLTRPDSTEITGTYGISGTAIIMTWTEDADAEITGTLAGNILSITADGNTINFTKK